MNEISWLGADELAHVIHESDLYCIVITPTEWMLKSLGLNKDLGCYCVVNKEHNTIEGTASNLPIAFSACEVLEQHLKEAIDKINTKETKGALSIVSISQNGPK